MFQRISPGNRRRGTITPFFLVVLVVLFGAFAVAVDYSFLAATRVEMQNTTDAAATAAADIFVDDLTLLHDPTINQSLMAASSAAAIQFAQANTVAGQPFVLLPNPDNFVDGDIEFGTIYPATNVFIQADATDPKRINAVRIIGQRTQARGNPTGTLASGAFGLSFVDMRTSSVALLDHDVIGFRPNLSRRLPLAPLAILSDPSGLDPQSWEFNIVAGNGTPFAGGLLPAMVVQLRARGGRSNGQVLDIGTTPVAAQLERGIHPSDLQDFGGQFVLDDNNELEVPTIPQATVDYLGLADALSNLQAGAVQRVFPLYARRRHHNDLAILSGFVAARVVSVMPISGGGIAFTLQPTVIAVPAAVAGVSRLGGAPLLTPYIVKVRLVQ